MTVRNKTQVTPETSMAEPDEKRRRVGSWNVQVGARAAGIKNPIREIMDTIAGKENPAKRVLSLAQGDPSAYPHLRVSEVMVNAVACAVAGATANGYQPSQGNGSCRAAVAEYFSVKGRPASVANDVFMAIGCSEALSHCVAALASPGANMLLPRPGFCLYEVLCDYHGVGIKYYDLLPDKGWQVDLESVRRLADDKTCAILVNNPSNPCGAVYSRSHLADVMGIAEELRLPVIADEVYTGMTFGEPFVSCAEVAPRVPVMTVCALSKRWLAPGWRVGWIVMHDTDGILSKAGVHETILKLCQVSLGPSAPIQAAIPTILRDTPPEWYAHALKSLKDSADCCVRRCKTVPGLEVASNPEGAMYIMIRIVPGVLKGLDDDVVFARALLSAESVVVLPGQCFRYPGFFRIVFAADVPVLEETWDRIEDFCKLKAEEAKA